MVLLPWETEMAGACLLRAGKAAGQLDFAVLASRSLMALHSSLAPRLVVGSLRCTAGQQASWTTLALP
ncbi:hypothetical protein DMT42_34220 [Streptomyces actuosus]|uniref:Uncharacterized protein n=1 Tax=Streptomyces actuosus TaxID=1885 RepID=A0A2U9PAL1_STRAS|nr:hypothetical protein DMT42_34220 [Streptomyces actuosus]